MKSENFTEMLPPPFCIFYLPLFAFFAFLLFALFASLLFAFLPQSHTEGGRNGKRICDFSIQSCLENLLGWFLSHQTFPNPILAFWSTRKILQYDFKFDSIVASISSCWVPKKISPKKIFQKSPPKKSSKKLFKKISQKSV